MKLNDLGQMLFFSIVLDSKVKKDPEINKEPCFGNPHGYPRAFEAIQETERRILIAMEIEHKE